MQNKPFELEIKAGEKYFWCSCGKSSKDPLCDGSHKGTGMRSLCFEASEDQKVYLCGCKKTKNPPYCDGSHNA